MRLVCAIVACLVVAQCATQRDERFRVGESASAFVIMGVAESASNTSPRYTVLWRQLGGDGQFMRYGAKRIFEVRTQSGESIQAPGIPGEFVLAEVEPGAYALDSVFALIREGAVNYVANGVVRGPERPGFEVRPGEAIYIGIWETNLEEVVAVTRPWRLEQSDLDAVLRQANLVDGPVRIVESHTVSVPCAPYRLNTVSQRQVC